MTFEEFFSYEEFDPATGIGRYTTKDGKQSYLFTEDEIYYIGQKTKNPQKVVDFDDENRTAKLQYDSGIEGVGAIVRDDDDAVFLSTNIALTKELANGALNDWEYNGADEVQSQENDSNIEEDKDILPAMVHVNEEENAMTDFANVGDYCNIKIFPSKKQGKGTQNNRTNQSYLRKIGVKIPARLVISKNIDRPEDYSLYLIASKGGFAGHDINEYADPTKLIEKYGAVEVHKVHYDNKGNLNIEWFNDDDRLNKERIQAVSDIENFTQFRKSYPISVNEGADVKKFQHMMNIKNKVALGIVSGAVAALLLVGGPLSYFVGPNQSAEKNAEQKQVLTNALDFYESSIFVYKDGKPISAGEKLTILNNVDLIKTQDGFWGWGKKYNTAEACGEEFGKIAATELAQNYVQFSTSRVDGKIVADEIYYPIVVGSNDFEGNDMTNRDIFINDLVSRYGFAKEDADMFVTGYEKGYMAIVEEKVLEQDSQIGGSVVDPNPDQPDDPIVENPVEIDYNDVAIANEIKTVIQNEFKRNYSTEDINLVYASLQDKKLFVNADNYLYEISLPETTIESNEDLIQEIQNSTVVESENIFKRFQNLNVEQYLQDLIDQKGANTIFINHTFNNDGTFSMQTEAICIFDNGAKIEKVQLPDVTAIEGAELNFDAVWAQLDALSWINGNGFVGNENWIISSDAVNNNKTESFNDNELMNQPQSQLENVEKTL